jgi:hypothetical protein
MAIGQKCGYHEKKIKGDLPVNQDLTFSKETS